jgi:hypothetical protein
MKQNSARGLIFNPSPLHNSSAQWRSRVGWPLHTGERDCTGPLGSHKRQILTAWTIETDDLFAGDLVEVRGGDDVSPRRGSVVTGRFLVLLQSRIFEAAVEFPYLFGNHQ